MKVKKNPGTIVSSAVLGVLIALALVMMLIEKNNFKKRVVNISAQKVQLEQKYQLDPFPVQENVTETEKNLNTLHREFEKLVTDMGRGQKSLEPANNIQPLEWVTMLSAMQAGLRKSAAEKTIELKNKDFQFGFDRYKDGSPPVPAEVPRLAWQLAVVGKLVNLFYERGISELSGIKREEFEAAAAGRRVRGGETVVETNALYETESMVFEFVARESALMGILNKLAESDLFVVVKSLDIDVVGGVGFNPDDFKRPTDSSDSSASKGRVLLMDERPPSERIVSGSVKALPVKVIMELVVYRFRSSGSAT